MSIVEHIVNIELLAAADASIKELTTGIEKERGDLGDVRDELTTVEARLEVDRTSVVEMDKTRNDLVTELRQMVGQVSRSRERLQRARNVREQNAAERELDEMRKIQRDRDDEIKKLQDLGDLARTSIEGAEVRQTELTARLAGSEEGVANTIKELQSKLEAHKVERERLTKTLPRMTFRRYQRLHQRGRVPVAKTHDGTCLACFVKMPPMLFHRMLAQNSFGECDNCHRIIYYVPLPEVSEEDESVAGADDKAGADGASDEAAADTPASDKS